MFAISTILIDSSGSRKLERGTLHSIPAELISYERLEHYSSVAKPGWSIDDWGYNLFCRFLPSGELLVIPGLEVVGERRARRRFHGYKPYFTKAEIENFATSVILFSQQESRRVQTSLNMLIHDLRSLSTTILHSANEARLLLNRDLHEAEVRIGNVEAAQGILRMRIDAFDLLGNTNAILPKRTVPVFRKVDKVVRFFKCSAALSRKQVTLGGQSHRVLYGPDVFELVPFSLLDNAVKYSPIGSWIEVTVTETDQTRVTVTSLGPRIRKGEEESIFSTGVRGLGAIDTGIPGTGVGLHLVARIVRDFFKGNVWVQQSPNSRHIDQREYFETTFTVDVPTLAA